jgi:hypothetical protein
MYFGSARVASQSDPFNVVFDCFVFGWVWISYLHTKTLNHQRPPDEFNFGVNAHAWPGYHNLNLCHH